MSEQAKLIYLQERVEDAREDAHVGLILFIIGFVLVCRGMSGLFGGYLGELVDSILLAIGVLLAGYEIPVSLHYRHQYSKLLDQLKTVATSPTCPRCGREVQ